MRIPLIGLGLLTALVSLGRASWPAGGLPLAPISLGAQFRPHVLVAGGNAFVYWEDGRWLDGYDIYGQMVTAAGQIAPSWPDTGLMVVRASDEQVPATGFALADGSFLVTLADYRDFGVIGGTGLDPYVSRVRQDATIDPAWPRHGFQAVNRLGPQRPAVVAQLSPDTLIILFGSDSPEDDVLAQRIAVSPSGPSAEWSMDAVLVAGGPRSVLYVDVATDGAGGCFISFDDFAPTDGPDPGDSDVFLTRIGRDGTPYPGWTVQGRPVAVAEGYQEESQICADAAGGVYVAWSDARSGGVLPYPDYLPYVDIRLARLDAEGAHRSGWPADGLLVCGRAGMQELPKLLPDGTGGVWVLWNDHAAGGVAVQRVLADGSLAPGWPVDGLRVTVTPRSEWEPKMVLDGFGGLYVKLEHASAEDVYLQHVLGNGVRDPQWPPDGRLITTLASSDHNSDIAADGTGGCYVAFMKRLNDAGPVRVHLTRIGADGVVPVKLAEATYESSPNRVLVTWHGVESPTADLSVQRRPEGTETWTMLGTAVVRASDVVEYDDTNVEPGTRYAYRLTRGVEVLSTEEWVSVPRTAVFALGGATPNPALSRELNVAFSLTGSAAAQLEVFDLAGRREHMRALKGLEPGRHVLPLADARLAPGVHWLRLTEGANVAHTRVVVVR